MRVIAGSLKGRRLKTPTWDGLRPTADKLRETLFNVIAPRVGGARVLDAYAGTGAVGIEAISRGASHVTFLESDRRAVQLIADNLALCGLSEGCAIIRASVDRGVQTLCADPAFTPFDVVILDPPYDADPGAAVGAAESVVAPHGLVVVEHARRRAVPERVGALTRRRDLVSGDSALAFYEIA